MYEDPEMKYNRMKLYTLVEIDPYKTVIFLNLVLYTLLDYKFIFLNRIKSNTLSVSGCSAPGPLPVTGK